MPRTVIKGQALTDFVAELTYPTTALGGAIDMPSRSVKHKKDDELTNLSNVWSLRINDSSNINGSGVDVILERPTGEKINYTLRLEFSASNNEVEYEALLVRL